MQIIQRSKFKNCIYFAIGAILLLFYFLFDPMKAVFMPQCLFHKVTGLQCMGCGSQRMLHALLHGEFKAAFQYNALLFCALPLIFFLLYVEFSRTRHPKLYAEIHKKWVIIMTAAILVIWLPVRNILGI